MGMNTRNIVLSTLLLTSLYGMLFGLPAAMAGDYETGLQAYRQGDYSTAIKALRSTLSGDSQNVNVRYYLADALLRANRLSEAQTEFQNILTMAPHSQAARLSKTALANIKTYTQTTGRNWRLASGNNSTSGSLSSTPPLSSGSSPEPTLSSGPDRLTGFTIKNGDDYFNNIGNASGYVRWSFLKMPLRVYVDKAPRDISYFEAGYSSTVPEAMDVWKKALGGQLSYRMVNQPNEADILVGWVNGIDKHGFIKDENLIYTAGTTLPSIANGQLKTMRIQVATLDIERKPQNRNAVLSTMIHEMGHALGLLGHSRTPGDMMYPETEGTLFSLSQRDLNTIRKLYVTEADISNVPPSSTKKADPMQNVNRLKKLDELIAQKESELKTEGDALGWLNLGLNYMQKADALKKLGVAHDPWLDKAIEAITTAIRLEPQNADNYSRRAVVYAYRNQLPTALSDLDMAIRYNNKNPEYHLQKAMVLAEMGRKGEALNELNTAKGLSKTGLDAERIKQLEASLSK